MEKLPRDLRLCHGHNHCFIIPLYISGVGTFQETYLYLEIYKDYLFFFYSRYINDVFFIATREETKTGQFL